MTNAFLATFDNEPALVNPGMQRQFEAFLGEAHLAFVRLEARQDRPVMQDDFWPASDSWMAAYRPYVVKNGILLIPVKGVLIHGMGYAIGNYATGYVYLAKALERGLSDPNVKGIAWIHDSPGGHVAGNFDLADRIFAARGQKPMRAFASESSYSASYSLASAAGPVTVSRTGGVGSIGVVTTHIDVSKAMDADGVKVTFIHFGKHKVDGNAYEALAPAVKERIQARIDSLGEIFVSTVARNRGMEAKAVRDTEALTFTAEEATSNGLADEIGSLDDAIAAFAADMSNQEDTKMTVVQAATLPARTSGETQVQTRAVKELIDVVGSRSDAVERRAQPLAEDPSTLSRAELALRDAGYKPRAKPLAEDPSTLSRAELALRESGYTPRAKLAEDPSTLSRAELALREAGYKPRTKPVAEDPSTLSRAELALREAGYKPRAKPVAEDPSTLSRAELALRDAGYKPH